MWQKNKKKSAQFSYREITIIDGAKNDDDDHDIGDVTKNEKNHFCKFSYPVITINGQFDENEDGDVLYWWCRKNSFANLQLSIFK